VIPDTTLEILKGVRLPKNVIEVTWLREEEWERASKISKKQLIKLFSAHDLVWTGIPMLLHAGNLGLKVFEGFSLAARLHYDRRRRNQSVNLQRV
jgi:hypothetical protein